MVNPHPKGENQQKRNRPKLIGGPTVGVDGTDRSQARTARLADNRMTVLVVYEAFIFMLDH